MVVLPRPRSVVRQKWPVGDFLLNSHRSQILGRRQSLWFEVSSAMPRPEIAPAPLGPVASKRPRTGHQATAQSDTRNRVILPVGPRHGIHEQEAALVSHLLPVLIILPKIIAICCC